MYEVAFFGPEGSFVLPVNPAKIPIRESADHTTLNILGLGEAIRPGVRKLKQYDIECYLPPDVADAGVAFFSGLLDSRAAIRMIYSRNEREPENVAVVLQTFEHEERGGEPGAVYCKLSLREFRAIQATVIT